MGGQDRAKQLARTRARKEQKRKRRKVERERRTFELAQRTAREVFGEHATVHRPEGSDYRQLFLGEGREELTLPLIEDLVKSRGFDKDKLLIARSRGAWYSKPRANVLHPPFPFDGDPFHGPVDEKADAYLCFIDPEFWQTEESAGCQEEIIRDHITCVECEFSLRLEYLDGDSVNGLRLLHMKGARTCPACATSVEHLVEMAEGDRHCAHCFH